MATTQQIQQLYIGLLGRAADKAGLDFWMSEIAAGKRTLTDVQAAFADSPEFKGYYGAITDRAALVEAIYVNLFERAPDAAGKAYWVGTSLTADQLISAFLQYASPADQNVINNKVTVAQYYTAAAGADVNLAAAAAVVANVDGTPASVSAALLTLPVSNATLTAAVSNWEAANGAKAAFIAGLGDLDNNPATPNTAVQVKALLGVAPSPLAAFNANAFSSVDLAASSTAAQQEAAFVTARAALNVSIAAKQADVTDAQNAVNALTDTVDVNAYIAAKQAAGVTEAAKAPALAAALGAIASFNSLNGAATDVLDTEYSVSGAGVVTATGELAVLAELKDGALVAKAGVTEATNKGITDLLAKINADIAARVADVKADEALATAAAKVGTTGDSVKVDALLAAQVALQEEQGKSAALEKAITDVKQAYSLNAQLDAHDAAIAKAFGAIGSGANVLGAVDTNGAGGAPVADTATASKELFIFGGASAIITGTFGAGGDQLFIGSQYSLVKIDAGVDPTIASVGNSGALEVFARVTGADTTLYVEKQAFSGNAAGAGNFETIVLTGVTADLTQVGGFLQLA